MLLDLLSLERFKLYKHVFAVGSCNRFKAVMTINRLSFSMCPGLNLLIAFVTGSAKRYTNAQAMIFLYKRCCSKTRNIFYSLKKNFFEA